MKGLLPGAFLLIPLSAGVVLDDFHHGDGGAISLSECGKPQVNPFVSSRTGDAIMGGPGVRNFRIYAGDCLDPGSASTLTVEVDQGLKLTLGAGQRVDFNLLATGQAYTVGADDRYFVYEVAEAEGVSSVMFVGLRLAAANNQVSSLLFPYAIPEGPGRYYFDLAGAAPALVPGTVFDAYELILLPLGPRDGTRDVRLTLSRLEIVSVPEPGSGALFATVLASAAALRAGRSLGKRITSRQAGMRGPSAPPRNRAAAGSPRGTPPLLPGTDSSGRG